MLNIAICFAWRACIKRTYSDHTRFSAFKIPELVINSLWPSDAIWQYKDWSLLLKVIQWHVAWRHNALHYLHHCWLASIQNYDFHLTKILLETLKIWVNKCVFEKYTVEITAASLRGKLIENGTLWKECILCPRPVLAFGYCRCLRLSVCVSARPSVCVCGNHVLVRAITHHPFKLGSPNLDHRCERSLLFWRVIDLDLQGQI